jgi:hypothetical protein
MAIASAVLTFIMFFAGFHDNAERMQSGVAQTLGIVGPLAIVVACLILAMREKRANAALNASWGYGSALGTGVLTGLVGALVGGIFAYLYFAFLNPHMGDVIYQVQVAKMEAKGMPTEQIEKAEPMMRKFMTPAMMTVFQSFFGFIWTVLLSLIVAIFFRKRDVLVAATDAPPPLV